MSLHGILSSADPKWLPPAVMVATELCASIVAGYPILVPSSAGRDLGEICFLRVAEFFAGVKDRLSKKQIKSIPNSVQVADQILSYV